MKSKFFLVFILLALYSNGQNKTIDSLKLQLKNTKSDIVKATTLNNIANEYRTSNPKMMLKYANEALQLATKIDFRIEQGNAYHYIGNANVILGNYPIALDNFSKAQTIFENELPIGSKKAELKDGLARAYGSIGFVFMQQSNYDKALEYNFKAVKIYEQTNNIEKLTRIYNNIGVIYESLKDYFKALENYEKCIEIQKKNPNELIGVYASNIGRIYLEKKDYNKSLDYLNQSKAYFEKYPNWQGYAQLYYNYGSYYIEKRQYDKAIESANKASNLYSTIENKFGIADSYIQLGEIYFYKNDYKSALDYTTKALQLANELSIFDKVQTCEERLSEIYEKQNNFSEALKHHKLFSDAREKVANAETVKNTIRAEMNFDFDRKEMLQKEEQVKREIVYNEQSKSNKLKIFFSVLLALLISGIAFLIYNRTQLKKTLTLEKELAIYEQKALHLQMNPHFIFNCLGSISSFIVKNSTDAAIKYLAKFSKLMRLTLEYSKETLIPIHKEIESLQNYLELEQLRFNNAFQFKINKSNDIEDDVALPPLLLQPFLENAIIHGLNPKVNTGLIILNFSIENNSLVCEVTDNGIGINKSKAMKAKTVSMHKSMALDITKKRLEMMETSTSQNAKVAIEEIVENGIVKGTKAILVLPLQYLPNL